MQLSGRKLYTEPKLSPAKPEPHDMTKDWYVWFRFFDANTNTWKQLRFKKGINEFKNYKERLAESNALKRALKQELNDGWNPLIPNSMQAIRVYSNEEAIRHILHIKSKTLKTKTKYAYTYILNLLIDWLTKKKMLNMGVKYFSSAMAQEYMDWLLLKKNYSGRTFNDHLIVLRTFFNCFIEREWIHKNPFRSVKRKTQTVGRNLAYTDKEKKSLGSELYENDRRLWFFTQFMYHGFIRRTELTRIKVKHIDMMNKTIVIPGDTAKNNTQESVVIPLDLEPVIEEMNLTKYSGEDYLFGRGLLTCGNLYRNPNWITTRHNEFIRKLGINNEKGLYSWKHTGVCSYYYLTNKDIYAIMRQLRHRDLNTTMIYLKSLGLIQNDAFRNASAA